MDPTSRSGPTRLHAFGVMGRSLVVLLANLPAFLFLGLLLFTPVFVGSLIVGPGAPMHAQHVDVDPTEAQAHSELGGKAVVGMLAFLATWLVAGSLTYGVRQTLQGRRPPVVACVREGLLHLWRGLDAAFVTGLLVGIGFVLFVVPGLWLGALAFVAVPAALLEERPVVDALRRSAALTRGSRVALLVVLLATVVPMVLAGLFVPEWLAPLGRTLALLIAAHVQVVFALLGGTAQSVAYQRLGAVSAARARA